MISKKQVKNMREPPISNDVSANSFPRLISHLY